MDAPTQSIIVVIAHPVAGNPTQLAIERALASMELDWRVLSLDVKPADVPVALQGFDVTGIAGVLVDPSLREAATAWYRETIDDQSAPIDSLSRDESGKFAAANQQKRWTSDLIGPPSDDEARIWFGESLCDAVIDTELFPGESAIAPLDIEVLENLKWIALGDGSNGPVELDVDEWPKNDGSTRVIDLTTHSFTEAHPDFRKIRKLGYDVIGFSERKIGALQGCLRRWTGSTPEAEVLLDAIEKYLGV